MRFGFDDACLRHETGATHPETPDRLRAIREGLARRHGVEYVEGDPATPAQLASVHDEGYVESVRTFCADGGGNWDPDTVAREDSWDAILASAGLAIWAAETAIDGGDGRETPFSLGRPPGHHAVVDDAMGFCFANNVAIAAQHALDETDVERVAILDWDVHHGNGTQDIFYDRGDVFFVSIHEKGLYPGTGTVDEVGEGDGAGATMNVPVPPGTGDVGYLAILEAAVAPALDAFDPDLVIVSAGFDGHEQDPISRVRLSTEGYALLTDRVRSMAAASDAALAFVLEGGYGLGVLADAVAHVHETFDGREPIEPDGDPSDDVVDLLERVRGVHGDV